MKFTLESDFKPTGDQPEAIQQLVDGMNSGERYQTLLGVTGSGKTLTAANVVERVQRPTLVLCLLVSIWYRIESSDGSTITGSFSLIR